MLIAFLIIMAPTAYCTYADNDSSDFEFVWPVGPSVYSDAAVVMEVSTGLVLYDKNMETAYYPASITKVLTALLAIENCSLNETVTMSTAAERNVYGSRIGLVSGEQLSMKDALYGMLLESANEVSYAIGEHVAARVNHSVGSNEEFAALMNKRAKELGCVNSNFLNPHGLHEEDHYTCAYDMALIGRAAIQQEAFRTIAGTRTYTIPPTNKNVARPVANHHRFIRKTLNYDYAIAGKTGGTTEALTTLITFAQKDGLTLVAVVLHSDTALHAYEDTIDILNFAFDNYSLYNIKDTELATELSFPSLFTQVSSFAEVANTLVRVGTNSNVLLPNTASFSEATKTIQYNPLDASSLKEGENIIGQIQYHYAGKYIGSADIIYSSPESSEKLSYLSFLWSDKKNSNSSDATDTEDDNSSDNNQTMFVRLLNSLYFQIAAIAILTILIAVIILIAKRRRRHSFYHRRRRKR